MLNSPLRNGFDGSQKLFAIGIRPFEAAEWIDVDDRLTEYLAEKARLERAHPEEVFAAEAGTEAAQAEVLAMLVEHLPGQFPERYRREAEAMVVAGRRVALTGDVTLKIAARLVQEDLILMRRGETGWRLAACSLSFPSSWTLREKFGRPMHEVHAPVPGFGAGTRNADLISRMFDNLRPDTGMLRWNWSLYPEPDLYHPPSGNGPLRFGNEDTVFLRVERQTLRKLPLSGDILFTIRIYADPLEKIAGQPEAEAIARRLAEQLRGLNAEQLTYKGLTEARDGLIARLGAISSRPS